MKFIISNLILLVILVTHIESKRGPCNYCDTDCVKQKVSDTFKILKRLEKKKSLDKYVVEEESNIDFNIDIAKGTVTMKKLEISNILSAVIEDLEMTVSKDKTKVIAKATMLIPQLFVTSYGTGHIITKNSHKLTGLENLVIPPVIDTKGHIKATFKNTPVKFTMTLNVVEKNTNKVTLKPETIIGKIECTNAKDSEFDFQPDIDSGNMMKRGVERAYFNVIADTKICEICEKFIEDKENKFDKEMMKDFGKYFEKVTFDNNC